MNTGICTAVLRGHSSLVKGVAWDPIGSFVASQSDDKTVLIWRTSDWTLAHRTDGHWAKSLGSTFFRRLGWSPCGHFITTTHGFQKPRHSAPVLERGEWSATFDFLGHNAPIIVVKFNNALFRRNSLNNEEVTGALGWTNSSSKTGGNDSAPYNVIAIGSQDRTITVWTTASPRPLFVAKHFFSQSVVDLSWSPDGYSLFACSLDGTVATFHFDVNELGHRLTETEMAELKRNRYGDVRGRQANLAESPAQLLLEAASAKQTPSKKAAIDVHASEALLKSSADSRGAMKVSKSRIEDSKKIEECTADGLTKAAPSVAPSPRKSSPVKQREYRRPDGRKRIIPEAMGVPAQRPGVDFPYNSSDHVSDENRNLGTDSGIMGSLRKSAGGIPNIKDHSGITATATISESLIIEKVPSSKDKDGCINVERAGFVKHPDTPTVDILSIRIFCKKEGGNATPVCLEARPREHAVNEFVGTGSVMMEETDIVCLRGTDPFWSDRISGKVTILAGNGNFWAVGCADGSLQVYTKCGRRAFPTMMIGSAAIFVDCDESWKLLIVTRKGSLYVWDLFNQKCLLHNSLTELITADPKSIARDTGTIKIISAKLSKAGFPLVTLATRQAYLFDMSLMCWLSVADDCLPASNFASSCNLGAMHSGELAALHADIGKFLTRKPAWGKITDDVHTRAHLESRLASAQSLESPNEYRQCMLSYVRFLAREADESRLRELCESFLGPPTGMVEATVESSSPVTKKSAWEPFVLGMSKHKLLKEDILPAIASNRKVQRLLNEFIDLISEYEMTGANQEGVALAASQLGTANMSSDPPIVDASSTPGPTIIDRLDSVATKADSAKPVTEQVESSLQETNQARSISITEPMNLDPPASDQTKA